MKLDEKAMRWDLEVQQEATRAGWTVYAQTLANHRQRDPSLILVREGAVLAVYLRLSSRAARRPPVEELEQLTGARVVLWTPADRAAMAAILRMLA